MPRSSFDFDRGITQWRIKPLTGAPRAGLWAFTLGYDGSVPRFEDVAYGDYFQTSQQIDTTNVALIRCHVNITQPKGLPNFENVSKDIQFIAEGVDSPGNRIVVSRGVTEADINKSLDTFGCLNAQNNGTFKIVGVADPLTVFVDKAVVTEGPRSTITASFKGARWKFSLLIDGVEYARCIQSDRETGFYRDDLVLHCSKLTGTHTISFRITLIEQDPSNVYALVNQPPRAGLILWLKGDAGMHVSSGLVTAMDDQSGFGQDFTTDPGFEPSTGIDSIDGIPALNFPFLGDPHIGKDKYIVRKSVLKDRNGNPIGYNTGQTQSRTVFAVIKPVTGGFSITGGPVFSMESGVGPAFQSLFDLETTFGGNGFYVWSEAWRSTPDSIKAPDTLGSVYDGVTILAEWKSTGFSQIDVAVNAATQTLTPTTMPGSIAGVVDNRAVVGNVQLIGGGFNFQGSISEILVWDHALSLTEINQARGYIASRYPSIGL